VIRRWQHRVVMNLPGFMESVFSFVTAKDLKAELNAQFRAKVRARNAHPFA
jgi:hypothetical protein